MIERMRVGALPVFVTALVLSGRVAWQAADEEPRIITPADGQVNLADDPSLGMDGAVICRLLSFTILAVLAVAQHGSAAGVVEDEEPNDSVFTATATGLTNVGEVIVLDAAIGNGPLGASDRDLFSFETPSSTQPFLLTVTMVAAAGSFDGYLRLFDADGEEPGWLNGVAQPGRSTPSWCTTDPRSEARRPTSSPCTA